MECTASRELSCVSRTKFHSRLLTSSVESQGEDERKPWVRHPSKKHLFKLRGVRGAFAMLRTRVSSSAWKKYRRRQSRPFSQPERQHDIENTWRRGLENTKGTRQGDFGCDIFLVFTTYHLGSMLAVVSRQTR